MDIVLFPAHSPRAAWRSQHVGQMLQALESLITLRMMDGSWAPSDGEQQTGWHSHVGTAVLHTCSLLSKAAAPTAASALEQSEELREEQGEIKQKSFTHSQGGDSFRFYPPLWFVFAEFGLSSAPS